MPNFISIRSGVLILWGSNFWLSHKKEKSPLTHGLNYRSACDCTVVIVRLRRILPPKMPFFVLQKVQKFCQNPEFCHPRIRFFQQCISVTAINLFYKVLPKQFRDFWLPLFKCKLCQKACHKLRISLFFAIRNLVLLILNRLQRILLPKLLFFVCQKVKIH